MALLRLDAERRWLEDLCLRMELAHPWVHDLRERVKRAIDRGRRYELIRDSDIEWFVDLDLRRGPEWEREAEMDWALEVLDNPGVDAAGKRFRLEKRIRRWDGDGK
jgi:hypothetical protein